MFWKRLLFWRKEKPALPAVLTTVEQLEQALADPYCHEIRLGPGIFKGNFTFWDQTIEGAPYPEGGAPLTIFESSAEHTVRVRGSARLRNIGIRSLAEDEVALFVRGLAVIEGCAISAPEGLGVVISHADPLIHRCVIHDSRWGIALSDQSDPVLSHCRIERNRETGVWISEGSNPRLEHCVISNQLGGDGILIASDSFGSLRHCTVKTNVGIGIRVEKAGFLEALDSQLEGGGKEAVFFEPDSVGSLERCRVRRGAAKGEAVRIQEGAEVLLQETDFPSSSIQIEKGGDLGIPVLALDCRLTTDSIVSDSSTRLISMGLRSRSVQVGSVHGLEVALKERGAETVIELKKGVYALTPALLSEVQRAPVTLIGGGKHPIEVVLQIEAEGGLNLLEGSRLRNLSVEARDPVTPAISVLGTCILEGVRVTSQGDVGLVISGGTTLCLLRDTWVSRCRKVGVRVEKGARAWFRTCFIARNGGHGVVVQDSASYADFYYCRIRDQVDGLGIKLHDQGSGALRKSQVCRNRHHGVQMSSGPGASLRVVLSKILGQGIDGYGVLVGARSQAFLAYAIVKKNGGNGLGVFESKVEILKSEFSDNVLNGIYLSEGAEVQVSGGGTFRNQEAGVWVGGASTLKYQESEVERNTSGIVIHENSQAHLIELEVKFNAGGGVQLTEGSRATLERCKMEDQKSGAGLLVHGRSEVDVRHCEIRGNGQGGVAVFQSSEARMEFSSICSNRKQDDEAMGPLGAGVSIYQNSRASLTECELNGNETTGARIYLDGRGLFTKCRFDRHSQGGIRVTDGGEAELIQCTLGGDEPVFVSENGKLKKDG